MILLREALEKKLKELKIKNVSINNINNSTLKIVEIECGKTVYSIDNVILKSNLTVKEREYLIESISKRLEKEKSNIIKAQQLTKEIFTLNEENKKYCEENNIKTKYRLSYIENASYNIEINYENSEYEVCLKKINIGDNICNLINLFEIEKKLNILDYYVTNIYNKIKNLEKEKSNLSSCNL